MQKQPEQEAIAHLERSRRKARSWVPDSWHWVELLPPRLHRAVRCAYVEASEPSMRRRESRQLFTGMVALLEKPEQLGFLPVSSTSGLANELSSAPGTVSRSLARWQADRLVACYRRDSDGRQPLAYVQFLDLDEALTATARLRGRQLYGRSLGGDVERYVVEHVRRSKPFPIPTTTEKLNETLDQLLQQDA